MVLFLLEINVFWYILAREIEGGILGWNPSSISSYSLMVWVDEFSVCKCSRFLSLCSILPSLVMWRSFEIYFIFPVGWCRIILWGEGASEGLYLLPNVVLLETLIHISLWYEVIPLWKGRYPTSTMLILWEPQITSIYWFPLLDLVLAGPFGTFFFED